MIQLGHDRVQKPRDGEGRDPQSLPYGQERESMARRRSMASRIAELDDMFVYDEEGSGNVD